MINFLSHRSNKQLKKGCFLLSEPFLNDDYFRRAVIILCEHNHEGSFGFVLNNYINISLNELVEDVVNDFKTVVSLGGPVAPNNLYYLHTLGEQLPGSKEVVKGIYLGGEFEVLKTLINNKAIKPNQVRFFLGYSGWESKQLDNEMKSDSWIVANASKRILMGKEDQHLWKKVLSKMGGKFSVISNFPLNPELN